MKSILMFSYSYPPCNEAASRRAGCMAKYLPRYGWRPLVVTRRWTPDNCSYDPNCVRNLPPEALIAEIEDPGLDERGLLGFLNRENWQKTLRPKVQPVLWTRGVMRALPRIFNEHEFDAIWATYDPVPVLYLAAYCSRKLGIPWVADFRDVPGGLGMPETARHRFMMRRLIAAQKRLTRSASLIVTVSNGLADMLRKQQRRDVHVIMNGFDPDDMTDQTAAAPTPAPTPKFTLVYTGYMYPARSPEPFLEALCGLIDGGKVAAEDVLVEFYGESDNVEGTVPFLLHLQKKCRYPQVVGVHHRVSRERCDEIRRSSSVLMLPGQVGKGVLTSKLFEYLAAHRPILAGPLSSKDVADVLADTGAGVVCASVEDLARCLLRWYDEWKRTGAVRYGGSLERIMKYSRERQAGQLAELLDSLVERSRAADV